MLVKTVFAGFGGQGILSMGLSLAQAAMLEEKYVTYLPAYGAEVRGGTANCTVAVSDEEIASPVASSPDFIVVMNRPSLTRFQNQLQTGGTAFINSSLVENEPERDDIEIFSLPVNAVAESLGSARSANMVMLGAFIARTGLVTLDSVVTSLEETLKRKRRVLEVNKEALAAGFKLITGK